MEKTYNNAQNKAIEMLEAAAGCNCLAAEAMVSDDGDAIAAALEKLDTEPKSDEIVVYDVLACEAKIIRLDSLTIGDVDRIGDGIYLIVKNREAYDAVIGNIFLSEPSANEPDSEDGENDLCSFLTDSGNYFNNIDNKADACNRYLIKNYMKGDLPGYVYTLIFSLMALNYEVNNDNDRSFIAGYVKSALMKKLEITAEEYAAKYRQRVVKAIFNAEHLIFALRFKELPDEAKEALNIHYGDTAYSFFSNIFGNTVFNPYITVDESTADFLSVI